MQELCLLCEVFYDPVKGDPEAACTTCGTIDTVSEKRAIEVIHKAFPTMCQMVEEGKSEEVKSEHIMGAEHNRIMTLNEEERRIFGVSCRASKKRLENAEG